VLGALIESNESPRDRDREGSAKSGRVEEDLRPWIENVKSWMRQRMADTDRLLEKAQPDE